MKFFDKKIQNHLLNGGKIKRRNNNIWRYRPILINDKNVLVFADTEDYYILTKLDLTTDDWENVESKYDWDKIIKDKVLCVFSDDENYKEEVISILTKVDDDYYTTNGLWFKYCKPFNSDDYNIVKNIKEYEK